MNVSALRKLLKEDIGDLRKAEEALADEKQPGIEVEGEDEGEKLTHVFGAIWIKEEVEKGSSEKDALRAFMAKVRESIS